MVTTRDDALALIAAVAALPGNSRYLEDLVAALQAAGVTTAVAGADTPALYRWLASGFSYQGISDAIAEGFMARHGHADWGEIAAGLAGGGASCPKLTTFDAYRGCRYRKGIGSCGNPEALASCPVPRLPLRKGSLNEQAFSLFLFIRDRCGGDLVGCIDAIIGSAGEEPDPITAGREALLAAFGEVQGVSRKLLSMMLSMLLIGADPSRVAWPPIGRSMVAVDSLVHNFLHRTGILAAFAADHPYGSRCYAASGCEAILRNLAGRFDARTVNPNYPPMFPRLVRHAVWAFCAAAEGNVCNGRNIDDRHACELRWCPFFAQCARIPLRSGRGRREAR